MPRRMSWIVGRQLSRSHPRLLVPCFRPGELIQNGYVIHRVFSASCAPEWVVYNTYEILLEAQALLRIYGYAEAWGRRAHSAQAYQLHHAFACAANLVQKVAASDRNNKRAADVAEDLAGYLVLQACNRLSHNGLLFPDIETWDCECGNYWHSLALLRQCQMALGRDYLELLEPFRTRQTVVVPDLLD